MVNQYKKKPVVISAVKFTRNNWDEVREFTEYKAHTILIPKHIDGKATCTIETLEGDITATEGNYIIKGVRNAFYQCKPDIFDSTYELVS